MGRPSGRKNDDFEKARTTLLQRAGAALLSPGGAGLSFRQLADAAGVGPTTLRHYFPDRSALVLAVMASWHDAGLPYLHEAATRPVDDVHGSLSWFVAFILGGWRAGVGAMHATGLTLGLGHADFGPAYLNALLEPTLQVAEARLARHVAEGHLARCDVRYAAIALVSPVVMALLHQEGLGGSGCRPMRLTEFLDEHVRRFVRAHAP